MTDKVKSPIACGALLCVLKDQHPPVPDFTPLRRGVAGARKTW